MKQLFLYRHAHSSPADDGMMDHDRPLSDRGEEACANIAEEFKKHQWAPELTLCSTAVRTKSTLGLTANALGKDLQAEFDNKLYLAQPGDIFRQISKVSDKVKSVMIVGHNPGLYQCCMLLANDGDNAALDALSQGYPPATLAVYEIDTDSWEDVGPASKSSLKHVVLPK